MSTFASSAATATALISKFGSVVTFSRQAFSSYNPVTQAETVTTTSFSMPAVGVPPGKSAEFRIGSLEGRKLIELHLAPALGAVPEPGDSVVWAGKSWAVIWVNALDPAADGPPYALAYAER